MLIFFTDYDDWHDECWNRIMYQNKKAQLGFIWGKKKGALYIGVIERGPPKETKI